MPKMKTRISHDKKTYLLIAIGILMSLFCFLLLGRVGKLSVIYLFLMFILGDFTSIALIFITLICIFNLVFDKPIDLQHIYVIGGILIYLGLSMLCHIGIYEELSMTPSTILSKTLNLYSHYIREYKREYSCGGGIIAALFSAIIGLVSGKIGISLVAIALIVIGLVYIFNFDLLKLLKKGRLKNSLIYALKQVRGYFKGIHFPNDIKNISLLDLKDTNEPTSFSLQNEVNNEHLKELKSYIQEKRITCMAKEVITSYTSSRYIVVLPHRSELVISELNSFFNHNCFFIKNDLELYIETINQFPKLLTLKKLLMIDDNRLLLGLSVDNKPIGIDYMNGHSSVIIGEDGCGMKTLIRSIVVSLLIKGINPKSIFFYDLNVEFPNLNNKKFMYINNEKSASFAFEEAFNEYERRMDAIKYMGASDINSLNKKIIELGNNTEQMKPIFHIIILNKNVLDDTMLQKLSYVMQFGVKVGMIILIFLRNRDILFKINLALVDIFSFRLNNLDESIKLFGSDIACRLQKKGDFIYQIKDKLYHGQSPYISIEDFDDILLKL